LRGVRLRLLLLGMCLLAVTGPGKALRPPIHPSAWKRISAKFGFRILHSPIPIQAEK
jgi:hypothetical protein